MAKTFSIITKNERKRFVPPGLKAEREKRESRWSNEYRKARDIRSGKRWQKLRDNMRREFPICELCGRGASMEVHHIEPLIEAPEKAYVRNNLISLCMACHHTAHTREKIENKEHVRSELKSITRRRTQ